MGKLRKVLISVVTRFGCCEFVRLIRAREKVFCLLLLAFDYTIRYFSNLLVELIPYLYIFSFLWDIMATEESEFDESITENNVYHCF